MTDIDLGPIPPLLAAKRAYEAKFGKGSLPGNTIFFNDAQRAAYAVALQDAVKKGEAVSDEDIHAAVGVELPDDPEDEPPYAI